MSQPSDPRFRALQTEYKANPSFFHYGDGSTSLLALAGYLLDQVLGVYDDEHAYELARTWQPYLAR